MEALMLLVAIPTSLAISYVIISAIIYIYEEILCSVKRAKRSIRDVKWEIEWQWKLLKMGVKQWVTKS